jgi:hypothetical protein
MHFQLGKMKKLNLLPLFFIACLMFVFSCSSPKILYDYDKEVKFDSYKTYDFYPEMYLYLNQLDSSRIIKHVENIMILKGFIKSSAPDIYVNIASDQFETPVKNSLGIGIGTGGRNIGMGVSGGIPITSKTITQLFKVDLIDVANDVLIWNANYEGRFKIRITPEAKNEYFRMTFEKIFSGYPPK